MSAVLSFLSIWIPIVLSALALIISLRALYESAVSNFPTFWISPAFRADDGTYKLWIHAYSKRHGSIKSIHIDHCQIMDDDGTATNVSTKPYTIQPTYFPAAPGIKKPLLATANLFPIRFKTNKDISSMTVRLVLGGYGTFPNLLGWTTLTLVTEPHTPREENSSVQRDHTDAVSDDPTWPKIRELLQGSSW